MPKIDLHRHLEGSLRTPTLMDIARTYQLNLPVQDTDHLRPFVQMGDDEPDFQRFLSKFHLLRKFYLNEETISRFVEEAVLDAAVDNIRYLELRFSPQALASQGTFSFECVTDWVLKRAKEAAQAYGITVGLIVSLLRHEPIDVAEKVAHIAADRQAQGIKGIDLTGNEADFSPTPFAGIFREAKEAGLGITIHAGEAAGPESIQQAVEQLEADRIGHGVRAVENPAVMALLRERQIPLEICLKSNLDTGVVADLQSHPLLVLRDAGIPVTLNTDDPGVSNTTLTKEYYLAMDKLGLSQADLQGMLGCSVAAAFLSKDEKQRLKEEIGVEE